eukprot:1775222-Pyramimonas_sp.AAC.1
MFARAQGEARPRRARGRAPTPARPGGRTLTDEGRIRCTRAWRPSRSWPATRKPRTRVEPRIA